MKKKIITVLVAVLAIFALFTFSACDPTPPAKMSKVELSTLYKDVATKSWQKLDIENPTQSVLSLSSVASLPSNEYEVPSAVLGEYKTKMGQIVALVNMVGDLYANDSYANVDKAVIFYVNYVFSLTNTEMAKVCVLPVVDKADGVVSLKASVQTESLGYNYYEFIASYDFNSSMLGDFRVIANENGRCFDASIRNGKTYVNNACFTSEYEAELDDIIEGFKTDCKNGKSISASFQTEFDAYIRVCAQLTNGTSSL